MNEAVAIQKILAWQTAQVLGYEDEHVAKDHAALLHVDFDTGLFTPVMVGKNFLNSLLSAESSGNWGEVINIILQNFVLKKYCSDASSFFSADTGRLRYSKGQYFDSFSYLSVFGPPLASANERGEQTLKWTHCVQYLYMDVPEKESHGDLEMSHKHLFSWFWIIEMDSYQRNINTLRFVAQHDQLTGLYNRHMLSEIVRDDTSGIVILMDINKFKSINDTYGHAAGDKALRVLAQRLESVFYHKQYDFIFRLGGDEFLVVMTDNNEDRAVSCMQAMQEEIVCGDIRFTVSIGYSINENDFKVSMSRADAALYQVKENGGIGFLKG